MKIDIVIPTYNRLWTLKRTLPYYLNNPQVQQIIIVDDNSNDGTEEWIKQLSAIEPRVRIIRHDFNRGASASRNSGANIARAPLVFFADDDMIFKSSDGLKVLANELINNSGDIIAPVLMFSEHKKNLKCLFDYQGKLDILFMCYPLLLELKPSKILINQLPLKTFESAILCGLMLMRREVLEKVRYDETLGSTSYRDETDFQLKALNCGFRLLACPRILITDLVRNYNHNKDGGCHASTNIIGYEWQACKNNWKILKHHKSIIHNKLNIKASIKVMQLLFFIEHFIKRLSRYFIGKILRKLKLLK